MTDLVFKVTFIVPESELTDYQHAWDNQPNQMPWPSTLIGQFAAILQNDLYDDCGMSGTFQVDSVEGAQ